MSTLSNYIIQDLIQNVSKGVTETFKFVLEKYNSNEVFAYTLYIETTQKKNSLLLNGITLNLQ